MLNYREILNSRSVYHASHESNISNCSGKPNGSRHSTVCEARSKPHGPSYKPVRDMWTITHEYSMASVCLAWYHRTRFLDNLRVGLHFALGTGFSAHTCAIMCYRKRFRINYTHVGLLQIICDLLFITDGSVHNLCAFPVDHRRLRYE